MDATCIQDTGADPDATRLQHPAGGPAR
jgi:hypothetical protein